MNKAIAFVKNNRRIIIRRTVIVAGTVGALALSGVLVRALSRDVDEVLDDIETTD